ncbi:MAG: hypothetical protein M0P26_06680, partial [Bacteroidales bacterium]|nr:hypothetical protein [Bacteroidales bacterium]
YTLTMGYDNLHNITSKQQHITQTGVQFDGTLNAGYDLIYAYAKNPQQISTIDEESYRTEDTAAVVPIKKSQIYSYDANGNLVSVNTNQYTIADKLSKSNQRRLLWDEENRLLALSDNGYVSNYWYDANGERTVKTSGDGEGVLVNGVLSGSRTGTTNYTAYVNPYMVITNGGQCSKHIYIGSQRVVSKLCSHGTIADPISATKAGFPGGTVNYTSKYADLTGKIKLRYDSLGVTYHGTDHAGTGFYTSAPNSNENLQYFYHSDHLGSSSLITNLDGNIVQHLEYVPFGEVFIEERNNTWNTPYKFNAKELDEETGLYYYGARYMDPRTGVWLSVDPLGEKKLWVSSYAYCLDNPLNMVDPDGRNEYGLDENTAKLSLTKYTEDKSDIVHTGSFDEDGGFSPNNKTGSSIEINKGILNADNKEQDLSKKNIATTGGNQEDGVLLMYFISTQTGKEVAGKGFETPDGEQELLIGHWDRNDVQNSLSPGFTQKGKVTFDVHTHEIGKERKPGLGYGVPSDNDLKSKSNYPAYYIISERDGLKQYSPKSGNKISTTPDKSTVPNSLKAFLRR